MFPLSFIFICSFLSPLFFFFFFFNDTATTEIYTLSLHDALPISSGWLRSERWPWRAISTRGPLLHAPRSAPIDRKSTRLNSSHLVISYAVFCLKKKKNKQTSALEIIMEHNMSTQTRRLTIKYIMV